MLCFGKGGSHQLSGRMLYLDYSQFLFNRAPNDHIGSSTTPWKMLNGFGFCLYFNEDFSSRVEALRHHDQRRALLKRDAEQPDIMDDFADPNSDAVRSIYLDPGSSLPPHPHDDDLTRRAESMDPPLRMLHSVLRSRSISAKVPLPQLPLPPSMFAIYCVGPA